jgi:hypothetical protein
MKKKIRIVKHAPQSIENEYWPGKCGISIRLAVVWFYKTFKRLPTFIEASTANLDKPLNLVRMWTKNLPDPRTMKFEK